MLLGGRISIFAVNNSYDMNEELKKYVIIVAGGSGTRFGSQLPKQFLPLAGKPVLMHTIEKFAAAIPGIEVIVVLPQSQQEFWLSLCAENRFEIAHRVVAGGDSRYASVKNGLDSIDGDNAIVAVHDGVRPLVSERVIRDSFTTAAADGSAIPVVEVTDSVRQITADGSSMALDRASLRAVQTPQTFSLSLLREAYSGGYSPLFTDDASVVEAAGHKVALFDGDTTNIKITRPADLAIAQLIINKKDE